MRDDLRSLAQGLDLNEGAPPDKIEAVQAALGVTFPEDLVAFLRESNGAEGLIGDGYLSLFPVDELEDQRLVGTSLADLLQYVRGGPDAH